MRITVGGDTVYCGMNLLKLSYFQSVRSPPSHLSKVFFLKGKGGKRASRSLSTGCKRVRAHNETQRDNQQRKERQEQTGQSKEKHTHARETGKTTREREREREREKEERGGREREGENTQTQQIPKQEMQ
jgi:hypothetical protein